MKDLPRCKLTAERNDRWSGRISQWSGICRHRTAYAYSPKIFSDGLQCARNRCGFISKKSWDGRFVWIIGKWREFHSDQFPIECRKYPRNALLLLYFGLWLFLKIRTILASNQKWKTNCNLFIRFSHAGKLHHSTLSSHWLLVMFPWFWLAVVITLTERHLIKMRSIELG